jgi:type III secretion protein W
MRIDPGRPQPLPGLGAGAPDQKPAQGRFRGEELQWLQPKDSDGPSSDAAEEISMHFAEQAEDKALDDDKVDVHGDAQVMKAEEILAYLDATHQGEQAEKLQAQARQLLDGSGHPGVMARQGGGNPLQQFLALQYALQQGEQEGAPVDRLQQLRDALADLQEDHGEQIRARLNTVGVAAQQGTDAASVARFQDTYAELTLGAPTLAQTLKMALERFGLQGFTQGLQGLVAALGADLAATRQSTSPEKLQTLVSDLFQLEVVHTVLDGAQDLAQGLQRRHGHVGLDAEALVKQLVAISAERWVSSSRFETLADELGVQDNTARIGLLTGIKALLKDMPPRVFPDPEARQTTLDALQGALDALIAREEQGP